MELQTLIKERYGVKDFDIVSSGTRAITQALLALDSKKVAIPTLTCMDVFTGCWDARCEVIILDISTKDLQIDLKDVQVGYAKGDFDTVVVPHMFGIQADIGAIRDSCKGIKIVEDCSQICGIITLGQYSDMVVTSFGSGKWIDIDGGGMVGVAKNGHAKLKSLSGYVTLKLNELEKKLQKAQWTANKRKMIFNEIVRAGVNPFGQGHEMAPMRAMYIGDGSRFAYSPLHHLGGQKKGFPGAEKIWRKLDWVSIKGVI